MQVHVISLRDAAERRRSAASQLGAHRIRFEFFDGITAAEARHRRCFDAIDPAEFLLNTGREVTPGEIGCFASHRALWQRAADRDEPVMIMEDDFELRPDFRTAFDASARLIHYAGFLRLQESSRASRTPVGSVGDFVLSRYTKPPHCLMCYAIAPRVARRFVDLTKVLDAPVDVFIKKYWEHDQPIYCLTPYQVAQSELSPLTTIPGRLKRPKPLPVAARRVFRKGEWQLRRLASNLRFSIRERFSEGGEGARI